MDAPHWGLKKTIFPSVVGSSLGSEKSRRLDDQLAQSEQKSDGEEVPSRNSRPQQAAVQKKRGCAPDNWVCDIP